MSRLTHSTHHTLHGIAFVVAAVACFSVLDSTAKHLSAAVPVLVIAGFRYAFQAVTMTALVLARNDRSLWQTQHMGLHILRGLMLVTVTLMGFWSLSLMPVGEFTAIVMLSPLALTLGAAIFLKEHVSFRRWLLVLGGFAGALLIVRPGGQLTGWITLLPLVMVAVYAAFQLLTVRMARTEAPMTLHFYTGWVGALVLAALMPIVWHGMPDASTLGLLCLAGMAGTLGHFLLILAYARAPASTLSPYLYSQIGFAMLAGWLVFDHVPGWLEWCGIGLILTCGLLAARLSARE